MKVFAKMRGHIPLKQMEKCRQAAFSYMGAKALMGLLTFFFIPCQSCMNQFSFILRHVLHISIIGHFISIGMGIALRLLMVIYIFKSLLFSINFFFPLNWSFHMPIIGSLELMSENAAFNFALLINAMLSIFVAYMLIKAINEMKMLKIKKKGNNE